MIERIWIFANAPPDKERDLFLQRVEWLNLTDVALFVNGNQSCRFQLSSTREQWIRETARRLREINVDTHLVCWLRPIDSFLADSADRLRPLCEEVGARSLLFDAEEPWTKNTCGKRGPNWSKTVVENDWTFFNWPCRLGVTGIAALPDAVRPLINRCHYTLPQAYSTIANRNLGKPGITQTFAHEQWRDFRYPWFPFQRKQMVMGLATRSLQRPGGISQKQAMQKAIATVETLLDPAVTEVAYWSMNRIIGSKESVEFVRTAGAKVKQGISQSLPDEQEQWHEREEEWLSPSLMF